MKYIVFKDSTGKKDFLIFSERTDHSAMFARVQRKDAAAQVLSAGKLYIELNDEGSHSVSISVGSFTLGIEPKTRETIQEHYDTFWSILKDQADIPFIYFNSSSILQDTPYTFNQGMKCSLHFAYLETSYGRPKANVTLHGIDPDSEDNFFFWAAFKRL